MSPKSLMEIATMACIKNIKALESVGDYLPYENVRNILLKVDNATQLRTIEVNSPQIQGYTGEIWLKLIEREFPLEYKANLYKPQDPKKWYRVYDKYKNEHDNALQESENKLKNALAGLRQDKEKNTSRIVGRNNVPFSLRVGPKRNLGPRDHTASVMLFGGGSRTKTSSGSSVMRRVRREVKEIANIHGSLSRVPQGHNSHTVVKKAPRGMVGALKRAAQPHYRSLPKEPETPSIVKEYEERATFISDSEGGGDEEQDSDDIFDEKPMPKRALVQATAARPTPVQKQPATGLMRKFGAPAKPPTKKTPGILSNAPRLLATKVSEKRPARMSTGLQNPRPKASVGAECQDDYEGPAVRDFTNKPSSPESVEGFLDSLADQEVSKLPPLQRKRKPANIFMQRKRRVT